MEDDTILESSVQNLILHPLKIPRVAREIFECLEFKRLALIRPVCKTWSKIAAQKMIQGGYLQIPHRLILKAGKQKMVEISKTLDDLLTSLDGESVNCITINLNLGSDVEKCEKKFNLFEKSQILRDRVTCLMCPLINIKLLMKILNTFPNLENVETEGQTLKFKLHGEENFLKQIQSLSSINLTSLSKAGIKGLIPHQNYLTAIKSLDINSIQETQDVLKIYVNSRLNWPIKKLKLNLMTSISSSLMQDFFDSMSVTLDDLQLDLCSASVKSMESGDFLENLKNLKKLKISIHQDSQSSSLALNILTVTLKLPRLRCIEFGGFFYERENSKDSKKSPLSLRSQSVKKLILIPQENGNFNDLCVSMWPNLTHLTIKINLFDKSTPKFISGIFKYLNKLKYLHIDYNDRNLPCNRKWTIDDLLLGSWRESDSISIQNLKNLSTLRIKGHKGQHGVTDRVIHDGIIYLNLQTLIIRGHRFSKNGIQTLTTRLEPFCHVELTNDDAEYSICPCLLCPNFNYGNQFTLTDSIFDNFQKYFAPLIEESCLYEPPRAVKVVEFAYEERFLDHPLAKNSGSFESRVISPKLIDFGEGTELGAGNFSRVVAGYLKIPGQLREPVAIKFVESNGPYLNFRTLYNEAKRLSTFKEHANVIKLIAVCALSALESHDIWLVMALCEGGDLRKFLQKNKNEFTNLFTGENEMKGKWSTINLIQFSLGICNGMNYLKSVKIIHGDLAARNILLTANLQIKISDLGLARHLVKYTNSTDGSCEKMPVPFKYMPPEVIQKLNFSQNCDVWSMGVLLWEIFSFGQEPYSKDDQLTDTFIQKLQRGKRLSSPEFSNPEIYQIMLNCWNWNGNERPQFDSIHQQIYSIGQSLRPGEPWQLLTKCEGRVTTQRPGHFMGIDAGTVSSLAPSSSPYCKLDMVDSRFDSKVSNSHSEEAQEFLECENGRPECDRILQKVYSLEESLRYDEAEETRCDDSRLDSGNMSMSQSKGQKVEDTCVLLDGYTQFGSTQTFL